jgi:hypothetical protein
MERLVEALPPLAQVRAVPLQVPEVIVPTVARLESEVMRGRVVVEISILPLLRAVKLLFMVVREAERVSLPAIVIIVVPNFCVGVSKYDKGRYL